MGLADNLIILSIRLCASTLAGACVFLFLFLPAYGKTSSKAPSGHPQETNEEKDPIAILRSWRSAKLQFQRRRSDVRAECCGGGDTYRELAG